LQSSFNSFRLRLTNSSASFTFISWFGFSLRMFIILVSFLLTFISESGFFEHLLLLRCGHLLQRMSGELVTLIVGFEFSCFRTS